MFIYFDTIGGGIGMLSFRKMLSICMAVFLLFNIVPGVVSAKDSTLSYDQTMQQLETIKEEIQQKVSTLTLSEKEKIREDSYVVVNQFLQANRDLSIEKKSVLLKSLKSMDKLMYNVAIEKGNTSFGSRSSTLDKSLEEQSPSVGALTTWAGHGDILLSLTAKTWNVFRHGHAAILGATQHYVMEALPTPGVVHQPATVYWSTVDDDEQYYIKNAPLSAYESASAYASWQIGKPYAWETTLGDESKWYCSKLVFKAWEYAGYHIGSLFPFIPGFIIPADIIADWDVVSKIDNPY